MSNVKCLSCGMVNFATDEKCKKCGADLKQQVEKQQVERSKLTPCPDCEHMISRQAESCPQCGRFIQRLGVTVDRKGWARTIASGVALVYLLMGLLFVLLMALQEGRRLR